MHKALESVLPALHPSLSPTQRLVFHRLVCFLLQLLLSHATHPLDLSFFFPLLLWCFSLTYVYPIGFWCWFNCSSLNSTLCCLFGTKFESWVIVSVVIQGCVINLLCSYGTFFTYMMKYLDSFCSLLSQYKFLTDYFLLFPPPDIQASF